MRALLSPQHIRFQRKNDRQRPVQSTLNHPWFLDWKIWWRNPSRDSLHKPRSEKLYMSCHRYDPHSQVKSSWGFWKRDKGNPLPTDLYRLKKHDQYHHRILSMSDLVFLISSKSRYARALLGMRKGNIGERFLRRSQKPDYRILANRRACRNKYHYHSRCILASRSFNAMPHNPRIYGKHHVSGHENITSYM